MRVRTLFGGTCVVLVFIGVSPAAHALSQLRNSPLRLAEARHPALILPSTQTDEIFARLEARSIRRRKTALLGDGLAIASPGYAVTGIKLRLYPVHCAEEDWRGLVQAVEQLTRQRGTFGGGFLLTLPDGRTLVTPFPPATDRDRIVIVVGARSGPAPTRRLVLFRQESGLVAWNER